MFGRHGAAEVDRDVAKGIEGIVGEQLADGVAGRPVEDEPEGPVGRSVIGEEDHGTVEDAIAQRRVREQELSLQVELRIGLRVTGHLEAWET